MHNAVRYAVDIQRGMAERNANVAPDRRIEFRIGITTWPRGWSSSPNWCGSNEQTIADEIRMECFSDKSAY